MALGSEREKVPPAQQGGTPISPVGGTLPAGSLAKGSTPSLISLESRSPPAKSCGGRKMWNEYANVKSRWWDVLQVKGHGAFNR